MGLFKGKKKQEPQGEESREPSSKTKSDKAIKPRSPKTLMGKKLLRIVIWTFASLIFLKGAIAWSQGTRIINETNIYGNGDAVVSDVVKGFATDFATEYFTWEADFTSDRSSRIEKFVHGISSDMGLKAFDVNSSSRVTSAEVYGTKIVDSKHVDVSVVVWRSVTPLPNRLEVAQGIDTPVEPVINKVYMIVPVTLAEEGPVIESYPRFVSEQTKGVTVEPNPNLVSVAESSLIAKGTELADSYLRSWYEGNAAQLKYFYAETVIPPATITKSMFTYDSLSKVTVFSIASPESEGKEYRINADVVVKNDLGESFTNSWSLTVSEKDGKLYVLSNGIDDPGITPQPTIPEETSTDVTAEPENNSSAETLH